MNLLVPVLAAAENENPERGVYPLLLLLLYSAVIAAGSLFGGWLPQLIRLTHRRMQILVSLVSGLMLGVAIFHLLPHAIGEMESVDRAVEWTMIGLLTMFFLIRAFHFHQHGPAYEEPAAVAPVAAAATTALPMIAAPHSHDHDHHHDHDHDRSHVHHHDSHGYDSPSGTKHRFAWLGIGFGLSLHTLIDGIALGASVFADAQHASGPLYGLGTFVVVALHKPLDAISITSLMSAGGWHRAWKAAINICFSLMCPLGALLFVLGVSQLGVYQSYAVGCALAFSAGVFLCISLGDLLPEVEFHHHDRLALSAALLIGVALAYAVGFLEPGHVHPQMPVHPHGHAHP